MYNNVAHTVPPVVTDLQEREKGTESETTCEKAVWTLLVSNDFLAMENVVFVQTSVRKSESFWEGENRMDVLEIHVRGDGSAMNKKNCFQRQNFFRKII